MRRIAVVGTPGSGKSTLAHRLSERLGLARIDLDELFHGPDWTPTPTPEFRRRVAEALRDADETGWVVAGNYAMVSDITNGAADTIVWLDLTRWRCTGRVLRRSLWRSIRREQLWAGNSEQLRNLFRRDPDVNIVLASWQMHPRYRKRYDGFAEGAFWEHADVHRLRTPREVRRFLGVVDPSAQTRAS